MTARAVAFISILFCLTGCTTCFRTPDATTKNPAHPDAEQAGLAGLGTISEFDRLPPELNTNGTGAEMQADEMKDKKVNENKTLEKVTYTCPMHPEVITQQPGKCPKCGMKLIIKKEGGR